LDLADEWRLFSAAWREMSKGRSAAEVGEEYLRRRDEALSQQQALMDFRTYWETLSAALSGRDKIILDADKVPGRRNLWLLPLPPSGFPVPSLMPAPRPQTPDPRSESWHGSNAGNRRRAGGVSPLLTQVQVRQGKQGADAPRSPVAPCYPHSTRLEPCRRYLLFRPPSATPACATGNGQVRSLGTMIREGRWCRLER
jgi:hypothetical protein